MADWRERYELNAPGDFYVERNMCIVCRAPEHAAPDLMGFHDSPDGSTSHCYFKRQPQTKEEIGRAIDAFRVACCGALRYGGSDPTILQVLGPEACDQEGFGVADRRQDADTGTMSPDRRVVMPLVVGAAAGVAVAAVVYLAMALYVWTAIHSGWSDEAIRAYYASFNVVPPVAGLAVAWCVYRILRSRASKRRT